jgi:hypothetical protein
LVVAVALGVVAGRQWGPVSGTTTTSTTSASAAQPDTAVWPFAATSTRFTSPTAVAGAFAVEYLGFTDLFVGSFQQGDSRSGEVPIRSSESGVVTTVLVRQLTPANTWWVLGAVSPNITVTSPAALQKIVSPVLLRGQSTAYEAVVNVQVRQDGSLGPLARSTVMGGSMGTMGSFTKTVTFAKPSAVRGALVFRTYSPKDGHVLEASVLRVAFG